MSSNTRPPPSISVAKPSRARCQCESPLSEHATERPARGANHDGNETGRGAVKPFASSEHQHPPKTDRNRQQLAALRMNAKREIDHHQEQRYDGDEGNDQTGGDGLFGISDPAHAATEHQSAHQQRITPFANGRQRCAARQLPGQQKSAGDHETGAHQKVGCETHQRKTNHQIGRTPHQPGHRQAAHDERRPCSRWCGTARAYIHFNSTSPIRG